MADAPGHARGFSKSILTAVRENKYVRIRAGGDHRFTAVWVVVLVDRVFIRSWNDHPRGWFRAFAREPRGMMALTSGREIPIRARPVRGERLKAAVDRAYAEKYVTPGALKYVRGFARSERRRATTTELAPL
jgi:hypothetical protein